MIGQASREAGPGPLASLAGLDQGDFTEGPRAARKAREQRGHQQRAFELELAQANNIVDADTLSAIAAALNALTQRIEALEAHVGINGDKLTTEAVELPRFLSPKFGTSLGWPEDVRFSQPLMTKQNAQ